MGKARPSAIPTPVGQQKEPLLPICFTIISHVHEASLHSRESRPSRLLGPSLPSRPRGSPAVSSGQFNAKDGIYPSSAGLEGAGEGRWKGQRHSCPAGELDQPNPHFRRQRKWPAASLRNPSGLRDRALPRLINSGLRRRIVTGGRRRSIGRSLRVAFNLESLPCQRLCAHPALARRLLRPHAKQELQLLV